MGKKLVQSKQRIQRAVIAKIKRQIQRNRSIVSNQDKSYVKFFQFVKTLPSSQRQRIYNSDEVASYLADLTTSTMNFFNYQKNYNTKQLESGFICLANLFSLIATRIDKLGFERQFVCKMRRFLRALGQYPTQDNIQQKVLAIFYILALLIYRQRIGGERKIRDLNTIIFRDRIIINSFLMIKLPNQKKIGQYFGIIITYLRNKGLNHTTKKKIVKSILVNFCNINHQQSMMNFLMYLRSQKDNISLSLKDVQSGKIVEVLLKTYPQYIHEYRSFCILDYLHHLVSLFPILSHEVASSAFLTYLLQKTEAAHLHHPLHSQKIVNFIETTMKYLEPAFQDRYLQEMMLIQLKNNEIFLKLVKMFLHLFQPGRILNLSLTGYCNKLLSIIYKEKEQNFKLRAAEIYISIIKDTSLCNQSVCDYLTFKLKNLLGQSNQENKKSIINMLKQNQKNYLWET